MEAMEAELGRSRASLAACEVELLGLQVWRGWGGVKV